MNPSRRHHARLGLWLAVSGILAASLAAPLMAQKPAGQVQLELNNTPLTAAIDLLTQRSGAKFVVADPPALSGKKVTVSLSGLTVEKALNTILTASKIPWYKGDDGVFYINAEAPVAPVVAEPPAPAPTRIVTTEKIELRHQSPVAVLEALGMDESFPIEPSVTNGGLNLPVISLGPNFTPAGSMGVTPRTVRTNGRDWEVWNGSIYRLPSSTDNGSNNVSASNSSDQANRDIQELDSAGQIGFPRGGRRGTGTTGTGTGTNYQGGPTTGQTGNLGTSNTQNNQNKLVPDGIDTIFPYQEDNSLLVRGEPDAIDELKNIIALLDVPVKQVSIKAEFVTVTDADISAFGLNWTSSVLNSNVTTDIGGTSTTSGPTITMNIAQGNISATLTALRQRDRAHSILSPLISTLNNVPATIQTSEQYPIFQSTISQGTSGGSNISSSNVTYLTSQTGLQVLPRINRDGSVTVQLQPQVSQFNGFVQGPNSQSAPIIVQQQLSTIRRVKSGESIVLGGLETKTDAKTSRGIPFLEDLPFIGRFFRSEDNELNDSQLLIFLTPTIVNEETGAQVSQG
jgi:type II secretory pathway component GspD/PulD (secretin)